VKIVCFMELFRTVHRCVRRLRCGFVLGSLVLLGACATGQQEGAGRGASFFASQDRVEPAANPAMSSVDSLSVSRDVSLADDASDPVLNSGLNPGADPSTDQRVSAFRQDAGAGFARTAPGPVRAGANGIELAFEARPISEVVSAILGDLLGQSFIVDPAINGTMTLRSARPVRREDLPRALDQALQLSGYGLSQSADGIYRVMRADRTAGVLGAPRLASQGVPLGYGIVIVPLDFISAREMGPLLQPYTRTGGAVMTDEPREMLILSGPASQLDAMLEMVAMFDVDWLAEMSFALYPLNIASPDAVIAELSTILGGRDGPVGSQIELVALNRLNAVVVIAKHAYRIDQVEAWIARLDVRADRNGDVQVRALYNADAVAVAAHLTDLFGSTDGAAGNDTTTVRADERSNSLLIRANAHVRQQITTLVDDLDSAPDQVLIEALIVEVGLNDDLRYGVQWYLNSRDGGSATSTANANGNVSPSFPGFSYTYSSEFVRVALNAIASVTEVETISSPQIVVLNNQSALVQVGDQVPVVTQSAVSVVDPDAPIVNSVQFRDTGVVLNVKPRISPNGSVVLEVMQEVSAVAETTTSGIDSPTIQQRRFESIALLYDGETLALGGMIRTSDSQTNSGVPGLQRLPVVGNLFRDNSDTSRRTELVIFLTPHILRSRDDSLNATRMMRARMEHLRTFGFADG
jgi:general secretion pathway protein D